MTPDDSADGPSATPVSPGVGDRIRALVADPAGLRAPGFAIGVFHQGRGAETVTTGAADVSKGSPIDADTQFYAASTSKQFTALALIQLVLAGKIAMEEDIRAYLPDMPRFSDPVSVDMLLHHTGGIRDSFAVLALAGYPLLATPTRSEALATVLRQRETNFKPGARFDYNNGGYLLLSEIVERAAGEPFAAYVNRKVLAPMGMTRSFMLAGERPGGPNLARGYVVSDGEVVLADDYPRYGGSGGLITTLNDFGRYDHDIDTGHKVWTSAVTSLMLREGRCAEGGLAAFGQWPQVYASGLVVGPHWVSHAGSMVGFRCNYARLASQRIGLAVLTNRGETRMAELLNAIASALGAPPILEVTSGVLGGLYRSEDLDVLYDVAKVGSDALSVAILPARGEPPRQTVGLNRSADGSYTGPGLRLVPGEGGESFRIEAGRLSLSFQRT